MSRQKLAFVRHGLLAIAVLAGVLVGGLCGRPPAGQSSRLPAGQTAPVVDDVPPGHFLAGGERAIPVLEEISATLKRIEERLDRLEKIAIQTVEAEKKE